MINIKNLRDDIDTVASALATRGYELNKAVFIEHIKGYVGLGETSIIIAVACKHRDEAYVLSRYIIEEIKKRSPIWKKEHYKDEQSEWLKGNPIKNEKI